jgi:hypothetical protein
MGIPSRIKNYAGRYALVDDVPFTLPVATENSPALMAGFLCDYEKASQLLPGNELHPFKYFNGKAIFMVTVVNYLHTNIGKYIEYSIALAVTRGAKPAPRVLPALFMKSYNTGQYILDLPVSTEISVKGGKGIWGMPKHRASLDFIETDQKVSAQYELNGDFAFRIEIEKPAKCNMLMASSVYFKAKVGICLGKKAKASLFIGDHQQTGYMRDLKIDSNPLFTLFMPSASGTLDDHFECWFVTYKDKPTKVTPEGFESVINLGLGEEWPPAPHITDYEKFRI